MVVPESLLRNSVAVLRNIVCCLTHPVIEHFPGHRFFLFPFHGKLKFCTTLLVNGVSNAICRSVSMILQISTRYVQPARTRLRCVAIFKRLWLLLALLGLTNTALAAEEVPHNPNAPVKLNQTAALKFSKNAIGKQAGDYILLDRNGHQVKFSSYLGKPILVSFIYTSCSQVCPATTQYLAKIVKQMQETFGADSFIVLSVGFNAPWDSPQAMSEFADRQHIELKNWEFLSADAATMKNFVRDLGFSYAYSVSGFDHITQLTIIDQQGKIYGQVYGDNFDLPFLAEPLNKLVGGPQAQYSVLTSVGNQIRLFCSVYDPKTKTYRIDYLFFINLFISLVMIAYMWKWIYREVRRVWPYGGNASGKST